MPGQMQDPYAVLGVSPNVSDAELRAAYRQLVKRHHPDHNGGSEESERRFEEVQDAYARARELRVSGSTSGRATGSTSGSAGPRRAGAPNLDARLAEMERELREATKARERAERARQEAVRAAREAAAAAAASAAAGASSRHDGERNRPSDEDLGYFSTEDSISKILADARDAIADRVDDIAERLKGPPKHP
jgi:hypothetical protein